MPHGDAHGTAPRRGHDARPLALAGAMIALPWVVLYWLVPAISTLSIGADYPRYSIEDQLLLQFSLRSGTMPLFVPGFGVGQSVGAATQGQLFHPISHLAARFPDYWTGGALGAWTTLNLLSLGLVGAGLAAALLRLGLRPLPAFLAAFLTLFNLRMLDLFRYGASLQSYVGFVLAGAALLCVAKAPGARRAVPLAVATALMLCGGHPQVSYLGMLGLVLLVPLAPALCDAFDTTGTVPAEGDWRRSVTWSAAGLALGTLLASAYLLPFAIDFALDARQRTSNPFSWVYTPFGTRSVTSLLHSVFDPLRSDVHGSFAGSSLFAVPLLVPLLRAFRPLPRAIWICWALAIAVLATALAEQLPLYFVLWKLVPGFSSFRVPGRVTMLAPLLLALLLAWLLQCDRMDVRLRGRTLRVAPATLLGLVAALLYALYGLVPWPAEANELAPPVAINELAPGAAHAVWLSGLAALVLLALRAASPGRLVTSALVLAVVGQQALVLRSGTWVVEASPTTTWAEIAEAQRTPPGFRIDPGAGMETSVVTAWRLEVGKQARRPPFASLHWLERRVATRAEALQWLAAGHRGSAVVVETAAAGDPAATPREQRRGSIALVRDTFNELRFAADMRAPAVLRVGLPYSARWTATVDARPVPVLPTDGAWLGVRVPPGRSLVELRYESPASWWGMVLSCLTASVLGSILAWGATRGPLRPVLVAAVVLAVACGFVVWQKSLYGGDSLGAVYQWSNLSEPDPR